MELFVIEKACLLKKSVGINECWNNITSMAQVAICTLSEAIAVFAVMRHMMQIASFLLNIPTPLSFIIKES